MKSIHKFTLWFAVCATSLLCLVMPLPVQAHFKLNQNIRIFHVEHDPDGLIVYLRTPMSYLVADLIGPVGTDGLPAPAPFTSNRMEDGQVMHLLDPLALRSDPLGLGRIAAERLSLRTDDTPLIAEVQSVRVNPIGLEPGFATLQEAQNAVGRAAAERNDTYVGDAVVDVQLRYRTGGAVSTYAISSLADPGLPGQEQTANLILDYGGSSTRTYRITGLMLEPVAITGTAASAASTFIISGIMHILEGLDHVLFVLCMIVGASGLRSLIGRVSGFTVGHTATLILGFFGFAPAGAWFIPTVELTIALTIIYAAFAAVFLSDKEGGNGRALIVTTGIGLLHGFGFSFMLHQILRVDAENVWQSLLAFNIGVEIGQMAIVLAVWPIVLLLRHMSDRIWVISRAGVAAVASLVALVWVVERAGMVGDAVAEVGKDSRALSELDKSQSG